MTDGGGGHHQTTAIDVDHGRPEIEIDVIRGIGETTATIQGNVAVAKTMTEDDHVRGTRDGLVHIQVTMIAIRERIQAVEREKDL